MNLGGLPWTATPQNMLEMWHDYRVRNGICIFTSSYLPYELQADMNTLNLREMTIWGQLWWNTFLRTTWHTALWVWRQYPPGYSYWLTTQDRIQGMHMFSLWATKWKREFWAYEETRIQLCSSTCCNRVKFGGGFCCAKFTTVNYTVLYIRDR